jgi:hypothetical protein
MPWPTLIQLADSQYSYAYDGTEIRETWYVEPYGARVAFAAAMLGRVDVMAGVPNRTLPAYHFDHPYCLAVQVDQVPLDPEQLSYRGTFGSNTASNSDIITAVQKATDPTADIQLTGFMSQANKTFSAGALMTVTYQPVILTRAANSTQIPEDKDFDWLNFKLTRADRKNVPNEGLKLITPPNAANLFGLGGAFYPAAGISPEFKEEYQVLTVERRMLNPDFDLSALSAYQNLVDSASVTDARGKTYSAECLRFAGYDTEWVQVPKVKDNTGDPDGYSRWLNLTLSWDWRVIQSDIVCDKTGAFGVTKFITWNHILAYPGTLNWILAGGGVAWYYNKFSSKSIGVDTPAFPYVNTLVGGGAHIISAPGSGVNSPVTINP